MPIKISAGLSRKLGQANYGSIGASCNVDFEADAALLDHDLDAFQQRIRNAYVACAQAVNDELTRQQAGSGHNGNGRTSSRSAETTRATTPPNGCTPGGNSRNGSNGGGYHATDKQLKYLRQLAGQVKGLGARRLEDLAQNVCGRPVAGLTSLDASTLIDTLKSIKSGEINLNDVLDGAAV